MAKLTNHVQRTRFITLSTDKHYLLDSEDDFRSGCRNVSHQQQFFSELHSPGRSHYHVSNFWLGFRLNNKSSFRSFYGLVYCLKERVSIVRKTKVRNHRRVLRLTEREIQISSEAICVTNLAFVGEGVLLIVSA